MNEDRTVACLIGRAIGDALGRAIFLLAASEREF
jgi:ADP-ribosylglycohydrolase